MPSEPDAKNPNNAGSQTWDPASLALPSGLELVPLPEPPSKVSSTTTAPDIIAPAPTTDAPTGAGETSAPRSSTAASKTIAPHIRGINIHKPAKQISPSNDEIQGDAYAQAGHWKNALAAYMRAQTTTQEQRQRVDKKIARMRTLKRRRSIIRMSIAGLLVTISIGTVLLVRTVTPTPALSAQKTQPTVLLPKDFVENIERFIERADDVSIPWSEIEKEGRTLLPAAMQMAPRVQQVLDRSTGATQRISNAIKEIENLWWKNPREALEKSHALRLSEPRLSPEDVKRLPGAVRVHITDANGGPIALHVDNHRLETSCDHLFCRRTDRKTYVSAQAVGSESWQWTIPGDSNAVEITKSVTLPLWSGPFPYPRRLLWNHDILLAVGSESLTAFDPSNGRPVGAISFSDLGKTNAAPDVETLSGPSGSTLITTQQGTWQIIASGAGLVRHEWRVNQRKLLGYTERTLTLRTGILGNFSIERDTISIDHSVHIVARVDQQEIWTVPLDAELPVAIAADQDVIALMDDRSIRVIDQEGFQKSHVPIPITRTPGAILPISGNDKGSAILVPYSQGFSAFVFDSTQGFSPAVFPSVLIPSSITIDGNQLVGMDTKGHLVLMVWENQQFSIRWKMPPPESMQWQGIPNIKDGMISISDNNSTLYLLDATDHSCLRRIAVVASPTIAPTWNHHHVIVVDTDNRMNAYSVQR